MKNLWHDRTMRVILAKFRGNRAKEVWDGAYPSHRAEGRPGDCALYFGDRLGIGHREKQTAKPDLICARRGAVALVCEVEQSNSPKKLLGDILAVYASSWATAVDENGHRRELQIREKPKIVFVLKRLNVIKKRSSVQAKIIGMFSRLQKEILGPVEVLLADSSGDLDPIPVFPSDVPKRL